MNQEFRVAFVCNISPLGSAWHPMSTHVHILKQWCQYLPWPFKGLVILCCFILYSGCLASDFDEINQIHWPTLCDSCNLTWSKMYPCSIFTCEEDIQWKIIIFSWLINCGIGFWFQLKIQCYFHNATQVHTLWAVMLTHCTIKNSNEPCITQERFLFKI